MVRKVINVPGEDPSLVCDIATTTVRGFGRCPFFRDRIPSEFGKRIANPAT